MLQLLQLRGLFVLLAIYYDDLRRVDEVLIHNFCSLFLLALFLDRLWFSVLELLCFHLLQSC